MEDKSKTISEEILIIGMDIKKYQLPEPYPKIKPDKNDKKYIKLIFQDYASRDGEMTAVNQYIHSHITISETDEISKQITEAFKGIAIIEMFHLELLGDLINDLGEDPKFVSGKDNPWKSSFIPYGKSLKEKLKNAVISEEIAIKNYENHIKIIESKEIKKLLKRIVLDEKLHLEIFEKLLRKYEKIK
ncbi:MAG: manganese catalase family protein [Bacillota bacterium]|nr:manganese catalase family protein [Bacillota bacterium]